MTATANTADSGTVLDTIRELITEYVALPNEALADVLTLYTLHTHTFLVEKCADDEDENRSRTVLSRKAPKTTPYIYITSQGPGSGKTRLMEVMMEICAKSQLFSGMTGPTMFRMIESRRPTIFLDEVDTIYSGSKNEELRGVLNSGYKHNGSIPRVDPSSEDGFRDFSTFCPKVLAGIDNGQVPSTVMDRSIVVRMVKTVGKVAPFYSEDVEELADEIKDDIQAWVAANLDTLNSRENRPAPIDGLSDRQNDIIRPLLTIADRFPGWGQRARVACVAVFREEAAPLDPPASALSIVRDYMTARDLDRISTAKVCELTGQNGKQIASWFTAFGIPAGATYQFPDPESRTASQVGHGKGFKRENLEAAWDRYLPAMPAQVENVTA